MCIEQIVTEYSTVQIINEINELHIVLGTMAIKVNKISLASQGKVTHTSINS